MIRITLEGIDGCGKTTICNLLTEYLRKIGYSVTKTKEPGGTKLGLKIQDLIFNEEPSDISELFLFIADRAQLVHELENVGSDFIVCDRGLLSTLVYQGIKLKHEIPDIEKIILDIHSKFNLIDYTNFTFILDVSPEKAIKRVRKENKYDNESLDFFKKIRDEYIRLALDFDRCFLISETESPEETLSQITHILKVIKLI